MTLTALIFPHQLFAEHPALEQTRHALLIEEPLFFSQYRFHRQKLVLHRATMQRYAARLARQGIRVETVPAAKLPDTAALGPLLHSRGLKQVRYVDPCDDWLGRRLAATLAEQRIAATVLEDPHFLTPGSILRSVPAGRKRLFFTDFYIGQRKRLGVLVDAEGRPAGGKWSFDTENRQKLPRNLTIPTVECPAEDDVIRDARAYVREQFPQALGSDTPFHYPTDHAGAERWLQRFLQERLPLFGDYEDAIAADEVVLFHSLLTPFLNTGLLSPRQVIDGALDHAERVPLNALEGFLRQVMGWREYVRLVYHAWGGKQRTCNFWGFHRSIPAAFYDGTTGIPPVDTVIGRVLQHGYCHHIERLMILGNFMLLCEIAPDEVYHWFMECFIDAYDWVMVPNVYGMSQYADGGRMTTKPYISGSSYVLKMSNFKRGPWCKVWDALYWRFVDQHVDFFSRNPRMAVMVKLSEQMGERMTTHRQVAAEFLERLHGGA